jgi:hypothetical protein
MYIGLLGGGNLIRVPARQYAPGRPNSRSLARTGVLPNLSDGEGWAGVICAVKEAGAVRTVQASGSFSCWCKCTVFNRRYH